MRLVCFDFETVPCLDTARRLWGIPPEVNDLAAYQIAAQNRSSETKDGNDMQKPFAHRIVAAGFVGMDLEAGTFTGEAKASADEPELLRLFTRWLTPHSQKGRAHVVSWNGYAFDFSVARYRAMKHGIPLCLLYGREGAKNWERYDHRYSDWHFDLMDLLSGYGRSTVCKLEEVAALLGLPAKTEGHGSKVLERWLAGDMDGLSRYVLEDATLLARVFLRWYATRSPMAWEPILADLDKGLAPSALAGAAA